MRRNSARFIKLLCLGLATVLLTIFLYKTASVILGETPPAANDDPNDNYASTSNPLWGVMERLRAAAVDSHLLNAGDTDAAGLNPKHAGFFGAGAPVHNAAEARIDWHDYALMERERARTGLGEQGRGAALGPEREAERREVFDHNGFDGLLSDAISVNRSVADIRHKGCAKLRYLRDLPTVSVVVPFYNEHFSTLMRTCYSVLNRSPAHLVREIILVDDYSDRANLKAPLDLFVAEHLPKVGWRATRSVFLA